MVNVVRLTDCCAVSWPTADDEPFQSMTVCPPIFKLNIVGSVNIEKILGSSKFAHASPAKIPVDPVSTQFVVL